VFCAALPEYGLGVALKIEDGADRAANAAMAALLELIGALDDADPAVVARWRARQVRTRRGAPVGTVEAQLDPA
jgi:L-asparaginase II